MDLYQRIRTILMAHYYVWLWVALPQIFRVKMQTFLAPESLPAPYFATFNGQPPPEGCWVLLSGGSVLTSKLRKLLH